VYGAMSKKNQDYKVRGNQTTFKLKNLLGAQARFGWIVFMDEIMLCLPFLMNKGRPSKVDIQSSVVGQSGYRTWSEYVVGELKWNVNTWYSWRRAYALVMKYEYLKKCNVTASQINSRYNFDKTNFPSTYEEWHSDIITNKRSTSVGEREELLRIKTQLIDSERLRNNIELDFEKISLENERLRGAVYQVNLQKMDRNQKSKSEDNEWHARYIQLATSLKFVEKGLQNIIQKSEKQLFGRRSYRYVKMLFSDVTYQESALYQSHDIILQAVRQADELTYSTAKGSK
jgi:hypothetical protein